MKNFWERLSNTGIPSSKAGEHTFFRINLSDISAEIPTDDMTAIPVLFYPHGPNVRYREQALNDALLCHLQAAEKIANLGFRHLGLAWDDDGFFQKYLSPRYEPLPLMDRLKPWLNLYQNLSAQFDDIWIFLTVEELSPGGLDPLDGITIAKELENAGLKNIVAKGGTRDFPYLFNRRETTAKNNRPAFFANAPELASALWLKNHTNLKVFGSLPEQPSITTLEQAFAVGLFGIVYPWETSQDKQAISAHS